MPYVFEVSHSMGGELRSIADHPGVVCAGALATDDGISWGISDVPKAEFDPDRLAAVAGPMAYQNREREEFGEIVFLTPEELVDGIAGACAARWVESAIDSVLSHLVGQVIGRRRYDRLPDLAEWAAASWDALQERSTSETWEPCPAVHARLNPLAGVEL